MSTLQDWLDQVSTTLDLPRDAIDGALQRELLDVTREVAHGVARIAGPLSCYLLGLAVARGAEPTQALAAIREALAAQLPADGTAQSPAG